MVEIPDNPKEFHALMQERVCSKFGWGKYSISRPHWYDESRGFKLVGVFHITPEGVSVLKSDPAHRVFPDLPSKAMWWEKELMIPRNMGIPVTINGRYATATRRSMLARSGIVERMPKVKTRKSHGKQRLHAILMRGIGDKSA